MQKGMQYVPVLAFETDPASSELLDIVLTRHGISHVSCLVPLKKGVVPPLIEYFRSILDRHHPKLLITSWRYIGPIVRMVARTMAEPRPVEKWIVSAYSTRELEGFGVLGWADMVYEKPIHPLDLAAEVERCLQHIPNSNLVTI